MAALTEIEHWDEAVFRIETDTVWIGGEDGAANNQGRQLANRTAYLKARLESLGVGNQELAVTLTEQLETKATPQGIQAQTYTACTTAGAAPAFTLAPSPALVGYAPGQRLRVKFHADGTVGSDVINISGLGAKAVKQYGPSGAKIAARIKAGQLADVEYDGADLVILDPLPGGLINVQKFTASGTYTPSPGVTSVRVELVGGGGGGGGGNTTSNCGAAGGGAGGYASSILQAAAIGASQTVTVGAAGAAGALNANGGYGGTSSFGALLSATGGSYGLVGSSVATNPSQPGQGGIGVGGTLNIPGGDGSPGFAAAMAVGGNGGSSYFGGGGAGSMYAVAAQPGKAPGSGGGAGHSTTPGQTGAAGIVIIWEYL